ncbi:MAG: aminoacyl-tRNA hydrolase [Chloroflexota bacterium]
MLSSTSPSSTTPIYLLAGLGNPGRQYADTRHNIGFMTMDCLVERLLAGNKPMPRVQMRAVTYDFRYEGCRIVIAKPQTYMNESGSAVAALVKFYKIPLANIMVANDDVDLPFGILRLRPGGGSAGQKGIASIIERLGTQEFPRLRMGIGRPPGNRLAAAYVLERFSRSEEKELPEILARAADAMLTFVTGGLDAAMNRFNGPVENDRD